MGGEEQGCQLEQNRVRLCLFSILCRGPVTMRAILKSVALLAAHPQEQGIDGIVSSVALQFHIQPGILNTSDPSHLCILPPSLFTFKLQFIPNVEICSPHSFRSAARPLRHIQDYHNQPPHHRRLGLWVLGNEVTRCCRRSGRPDCRCIRSDVYPVCHPASSLCLSFSFRLRRARTCARATILSSRLQSIGALCSRANTTVVMIVLMSKVPCSLFLRPPSLLRACRMPWHRLPLSLLRWPRRLQPTTLQPGTRRCPLM